MEKIINGVSCKVVENEWEVYFDMALTMLEEIVHNNEQGKKTVMIVPVGPTQQYPILAEMVNRFRVSLRNVHFFNMDEYMISEKEVIDPKNPMSFQYRMNTEFYDRVDPELVMPKCQRHFPEPGKEAEYDKMIEDLGGVDLCLGGLGINGHVAFNEAAEAEDKAVALDDEDNPSPLAKRFRELAKAETHLSDDNDEDTEDSVTAAEKDFFAEDEDEKIDREIENMLDAILAAGVEEDSDGDTDAE